MIVPVPGRLILISVPLINNPDELKLKTNDPEVLFPLGVREIVSDPLKHDKNPILLIPGAPVGPSAPIDPVIP